MSKNVDHDTYLNVCNANKMQVKVKGSNEMRLLRMQRNSLRQMAEAGQRLEGMLSRSRSKAGETAQTTSARDTKRKKQT
jgi:hypothetical protein